ncbi:hypothetical protein F4779DRAFT_460943 [Xylariaceae sp. FL0662B]|nr:hypothetical protein F4779DRAFT_460943 [Xylariaceae sp. FL0662B]
MPLRHIALPSWPLQSPPRFPSYALATRVQSKLQQDLLAWKAASASATASSTSPRPAAPLPTLLSFTPSPTYTLGRRQTAPLTAAEVARLQAPLQLAYPGCPAATTPTTTSTTINGSSSSSSGSGFALTPCIARAPRGGLATYHGPGQVVLWPVVDLRSPYHAHFSVRDYACLLERTTIAALARFGIAGFTTANPGVWVRSPSSPSSSAGERKIAALGVHLRRHVTGLGVAVNWGMPVAGPDDVNPWGRIDACGLGDKGVTSVAEEVEEEVEERGARESMPRYGEMIASLWASEFASRLKLQGNNGESLHGGSGSGVVEEMNRRSDWDRLQAELGLDREDGYVEARPLT